eukprot:TRINITY_DN122210_c0_g1_i1.p1 TRINITY_DN122210_c0_g1~~TRINITY_DN122210_c0_g1_i1.p1  ORF type:complete len:774 (-),score=214.28 TRINITY_DN122210_c0_g1_i1:212-2218(-)
MAGAAAATSSKQSRRQRGAAKGLGRKATTVVRVQQTPSVEGRKPKVVVLGSGWGAVSFLQGLSEEDAKKYDITLVSPRNYFLYTPLLPACTMGSVEERSITLPIRQVLINKGQFIEAKADQIDTVHKRVRCSRGQGPKNRVDVDYDRFPEEDTEDKATFEVDYDILIYSCGAKINTFGIPGVMEHTYKFKEIPDARKVRERINEVLEQASLPTTPPEKVEELLSFVVVGGGPSGVEVAADLADFVNEEANDLYPGLVGKIKVTIVSIESDLLATYSQTVSKASLEVFESKGVSVLRGHRVTGFTPDVVQLVRMSDDEKMELKYGCAVWCAGVKEVPLSMNLRSSLQEMTPGCQPVPRGIATDEFLQVKGSHGSVFALGDAASVELDRVLPRAEELFDAADFNKNGELSMSELRELFRAASDEYPYFEEYANYLETVEHGFEQGVTHENPKLQALPKVFKKGDEHHGASLNVARAFSDGVSLLANTVRSTLAAEAAGGPKVDILSELTSQRVATQRIKPSPDRVAALIKEVDVNHNNELDLVEFKELLKGVERNIRGFPPTAQVAQQQGLFLSQLLAHGKLTGSSETYKELAKETEPFAYLHKGSLVFLGQGNAGMDVPVIGTITGPFAGLAWKVFETGMQYSWKNRALVALDWLRTQIWGRDSSRLGL